MQGAVHRLVRVVPPMAVGVCNVAKTEIVKLASAVTWRAVFVVVTTMRNASRSVPNDLCVAKVQME